MPGPGPLLDGTGPGQPPPSPAPPPPSPTLPFPPLPPPLPHLRSFAALVANVLSLIADDDTVDTIFDALAEALGLPDDVYAFMSSTYFPTLRAVTAEKGIALTRTEVSGKEAVQGDV